MDAEVILSAELLKLGFIKKGRRVFYLIKDDIIGLIAFERPSDILYVQFAIVPLFLPCPGFIYYSYGNRLNAMYRDLPVILKSSSEEQIKAFCNLAAVYIKDDILPFLCEHSTAAALQKLARSWVGFLRHKNKKYLFCNSEDSMRLLLYSSLCMRDYTNAQIIAKRYVSYVTGIKFYTKSLKEQKIYEVNQIIAALNDSNFETIESMLRSNREKNLALLSGSKSTDASSTSNTGDGSMC